MITNFYKMGIVTPEQEELIGEKMMAEAKSKPSMSGVTYDGGRPPCSKFERALRMKSPTRDIILQVMVDQGQPLTSKQISGIIGNLPRHVTISLNSSKKYDFVVSVGTLNGAHIWEIAPDGITYLEMLHE